MQASGSVDGGGLGESALVKPLEEILKRKKNLTEPAAPAGSDVQRALRRRLPLLHVAYDEVLLARNALDFDSLLSKLYELFQGHPDILSIYQAAFPDVCVDEFQDTSYAQYALLGYLTRRATRRIFAVADADQSIYGWNGAAANRVDQFVQDYAPVIVRLRQSYRSPTSVVAAANRMISVNPSYGGDRTPIEPRLGGTDTRAICFLAGGPDEESEARTVARDIRDNHLSALGSVLVLARSNRLLHPVQAALTALGIPSFVHERKDEFTTPLLMFLNACLSLKANPRNAGALVTFQTSAAALGLIDEQAARLADIEGLATLLSSASGGENGFRRSIGQGILESVVRRCDVSAFAERVFEAYHLDGLGRRPADDHEDTTEEEIRVWRELSPSILGALGDTGDLAGFLQEMSLRSKQPSHIDSVRLMTIHAAKGLEANHVYLVGMAEGQLPSYYAIRDSGSSSDLEEERRICFVGVTRARQSATLSAAENYLGRPAIPSRFIQEMGISA